MTDSPTAVPTLRSLHANGLEFAALEIGEGPLLLCLHGFPDTAHGFVPAMRLLAAAGYRVVAPFMRGYRPTAVPADGDYRVLTLAQDVIALVDALGGHARAVIGHDWGSVAAHVAVLQAPQKFDALVGCAVPHPGHFIFRPRLRQLRRSWYMALFQLPWWPEHLIVADDFRWLERLIRRWSPGWRYGADDLAPLKASLREPERLRAALGYYRQLPRSLMQAGTYALLRSPVTVPTLAICAEQDGCIGAEIFEGQQDRYRGGFELYRMENAGHFMQWEQPAAFAARVLEFLQRT
ncbi:alpha/beta hydrolase [Fontimonas sp. SYSU GA230001]|uniref:alpha/beta fold hydrolase n=1 Tax=Fontimonas sp. SYSU GA230001 TaxID=3142450 RepID=UPI0032B44B16